MATLKKDASKASERATARVTLREKVEGIRHARRGGKTLDGDVVEISQVQITVKPDGRIVASGVIEAEDLELVQTLAEKALGV